MPLNIQENEEGPSFREKPKPEPIVHEPREGNPILLKILAALFALLVVAAIGFLLYTYGLLGGKRASQAGRFGEQQQGQTEAIGQAPASAADSSSLSQILAAAESSRTAGGGEAPTLAKPAAGRYTIYISSYRSRADAEEEAVRWKEAGFGAFVREFQGWFRVALGGYDHIADAKNQAEQLKESFEQGYWIGPI